MKGRSKVSPGVSPRSPWARATPHPKTINGKKKRKKICIHKRKFLLVYIKNIQRVKQIYSKGKKYIYSKGQKKKKIS